MIKCTHCKREFKTESDLKIHEQKTKQLMEINDNYDDFKYICRTCSFHTGLTLNFNEHMNSRSHVLMQAEKDGLDMDDVLILRFG